MVSNSNHDPATQAPEIIERLIQGAGVKNATALASELGVTPQAVSSAKKKDKIPRTWLRLVAEKYNISVDWLLYGHRHTHPLTQNTESEFILETEDDEQIRCEVKRQWNEFSSRNQEARAHTHERNNTCNVNEEIFFLSRRLVAAQDEIRDLTETKHQLEMTVQELRHENEKLDNENEQLKRRIKSMIAGKNS